jgi:hypothetical protein
VQRFGDFTRLYNQISNVRSFVFKWAPVCGYTVHKNKCSAEALSNCSAITPRALESIKVLDGYLMKIGEKKGFLWRKRWCVLTNDGVMYYFEDPNVSLQLKLNYCLLILANLTICRALHPVDL